LKKGERWRSGGKQEKQQIEKWKVKNNKGEMESFFKIKDGEFFVKFQQRRRDPKREEE
jgi:hypothetical protein